MGFTYQATVYVFKELPNGGFDDVAEMNAFRRLNNYRDLKDEVNQYIRDVMRRSNCLVEVLYERNGEYYDSEEIVCVDGDVA